MHQSAWQAEGQGIRRTPEIDKGAGGLSPAVVWSMFFVSAFVPLNRIVSLSISAFFFYSIPGKSCQAKIFDFFSDLLRAGFIPWL